MLLVREIDWLRAKLADGQVEAGKLFEDARAAGFEIDRIKRAKSVLGISGSPAGMGKPWMWRLPSEEDILKPTKDVWPNSKRMALWLLGQWKKLPISKNFAAPGVFDQVSWVSERLLLPVHDIAPDELIGAGALSLLLWAKQKEDDFRQMYDCKRMERVAARPAVKAKARSAGQETVSRLMGNNGTP